MDRAFQAAQCAALWEDVRFDYLRDHLRPVATSRVVRQRQHEACAFMHQSLFGWFDSVFGYRVILASAALTSATGHYTVAVCHSDALPETCSSTAERRVCATQYRPQKYLYQTSTVLFCCVRRDTADE